MMKKVKVLYIIATLDIGGTERQLVELVKRIDKDRYEPVVCCLTRGGPFEKDLEDIGIKIVVLGKKGKWDFGIIPKLTRLIRQEGPGIIHTFLWTSNTWGRTSAILAGVPVIISSERSIDPWKNAFYKFIDRSLTLFTKKIIANANAVRDFIISEGISPEKVSVVRNGIDLKPLDSPVDTDDIIRELGLEPGKPVIGYIGRLSYEKNCSLFLDAAAIVLKRSDSCQFLIVGDGEEKDMLEKRVVEAGIESGVKFCGFRRDILRIYKAVNIVVLTSRWEGMPNILMEAGAAGLVAISTDVGGAGEVIEDGVTGFLVKPGDGQGIAEKILWLTDNPGESREMGRKARKYIEGHFRMSQMVERTQQIYGELIR